MWLRFFGVMCTRDLVLYDCVAEWVCMVTLTFCIFGQSGWMSLVCYFVPIKRFSLHKMCIMVWFVLLKTFLRYSLGREIVEESGEVSDWCRM